MTIVINAALSDYAYTLLPWTVALFFYFEAGRRYWQVMFLVVPEKSQEPLALLVKQNAVPGYVRLIFTLFWVVFWLLGWIGAKWVAMHEGRASPLDLK